MPVIHEGSSGRVPEPLVTKVDDTPKPLTYDGPNDEFKGKTFEEIIKMNHDSRKTIGTQGSELGRLREINATLERVSHERPPVAVPEPAQPAAEEDLLGGLEDDQFVNAATVRKLLAQQKETAQVATSSERFQTLKTQAAAAHEVGYSRAKAAGGDLFTPEILAAAQKIIVEQYGPHIQRGLDIAPYLGSEDVWKRAALAAHFNAGNKEILVKYMSKPGDGPAAEITQDPVTPFEGEVPSGHAKNLNNPTGEIVLSEKDHFTRKMFGWTEEEAKEKLKAERERKAREGY